MVEDKYERKGTWEGGTMKVKRHSEEREEERRGYMKGRAKEQC